VDPRYWIDMKTARQATFKRSRDEFSSKVKRDLERRVGHRCSRQDCRVPTVGPTSETRGSTSIGIAAHIAAAAPGGPRYDPSMTSAERSGFDNGIWLCCNCSREADSDSPRFTVDALRRMKALAEQRALEERGQPLPSARELRVFKAKALGDDVTGGSLVGLVRDSVEIARRELEKLDNRFTVEIEVLGAETSFKVLPLQDVPLTLQIAPPFAREFSAKYAELAEHGDRLEIDARAVRIEGSPIFGLLHPAKGKLAMETNARRKAVQRFALAKTDFNVLDICDVAGEVVMGLRSFTFRGTAFDGIYSLEYRVPLQASGRLVNKVTHAFDFSQWVAKSVRVLPYFDRFMNFTSALCNGSSIDSTLEIEGNVVLEGSASGAESDSRLRSVYGTAIYLSRIRDLSRALEVDIPFRYGAISDDDARWIHQVWCLLIEMKRLTGTSIGPASFTVSPRTPGEAETIKRMVLAAAPTALEFEQSMDRPLNLLGTLVAIDKVRLRYSHGFLRCGVDPETIRADGSTELTMMPADECTFDAKVTSAAIVSPSQ
jgi:hypothetical protein